MERRLFGTDGIRGTANTHPMTAEVALSLGKAAGKLFRRGDHPHRVVIGKDTRLSGYMLEPALTAGFTSAGMDVMLLGPMPTPAVAMLARSLRADLGVMISASHNPYQDNGIKLFGPDGFKLSDEVEAEIEGPMARACQARPGRSRPRAAPRRRPRPLHREPQEHVPAGPDAWTGSRSSSTAPTAPPTGSRPTVLWELGAEVIGLGTARTASTSTASAARNHPSEMRAAVLGKARTSAWRWTATRIGSSSPTSAASSSTATRSWRWSRELARAGRLRGAERGRDGDVESGPRAHWPRWASGCCAQGRRPLRGREDARARLQRRRRAVGPHRPLGLRDHRRRDAGGAADAGGDSAAGPGGEQGGPGVRAAAAAPAQRPHPAAARPRPAGAHSPA